MQAKRTKLTLSKSQKEKIFNNLASNPTARSGDILNNSLSQFITGLSGITKKQLSSDEGVKNNLRYNLISLDRSLLQYLYANIGIIQTVIDQPVEDGYKKGFNIKSPELGDDDIMLLEQYIKEHDLLETVKEVRKWARLFGGAGLIVEVAGQDPSQDFSFDTIKKDSDVEFYAADLWQLNQTKIEPRGEQLPYVQPIFTDNKPFLWFGQELNRDRVFKVLNKRAPSNIRAQLRGWGLSQIEMMIRDLNNYFKSENVIYELLDETKISTYKINNLNNSLMDTESTLKLISRLTAADQTKNHLGSLVIDGDDDINQLQVDFTGIAQILPELNKKIAAAAKMPMTKLFGQSAAGFNAGEDDLENYNAQVESEIRNKDDNMIIWMLKILCKKLFDFVPEIIDIEFDPLRELSEEQMQNVKNQKFTRGRQMLEMGIWDDEQFEEYIEKENLL